MRTGPAFSFQDYSWLARNRSPQTATSEQPSTSRVEEAAEVFDNHRDHHRRAPVYRQDSQPGEPQQIERQQRWQQALAEQLNRDSSSRITGYDQEPERNRSNIGHLINTRA